MLSKLYGYSWNCAIDYALLELNLKGALSSHFHDVSIEPCAPGGTFGIFFKAELDGKPYFIKTHQGNAEARNNLLKEINIMQALYKDCITVFSVESELPRHSAYPSQIFFVMDRLEPLSTKLSPIETVDLILDYNKKLTLLKLNEPYSFTSILETGETALEELISGGLVTHEIYEACFENIRLLKSLKLSNSVICHGDLSNKNILRKNSQIIVIDWEDAFLGVPGYDFCYWLTFFDQREFYNRRIFKDTQLSHDVGIAFMTLIVIVKSIISIRASTYKNNQISFNDRLSEILLMGRLG